jgi:hypothetical protein
MFLLRKGPKGIELLKPLASFTMDEAIRTKDRRVMLAVLGCTVSCL